MFEHLRTLMAVGEEQSDCVNVRYPVSEEEIDESERKLGHSFPAELRAFFRDVGYGFFKSPDVTTSANKFNYINRFLAPSQIVELMSDDDDEARPSEGFDNADIPFFEVADRLYLVMRPSSSGSHEVAWSFGDAVCDSLINFTRQLIVNPRFYHR